MGIIRVTRGFIGPRPIVPTMLLLFSSACSSVPPEHLPEDLARTSQALGGPDGPNGSVDTSNANSDVVVEF
jgi:hypothetical protein